jgi:hypothetical protein
MEVFKMKNYNGYKNYNTWNIAMNLQNDENLYHLARDSNDYRELVSKLKSLGIEKTYDGVSFICDKNTLDIKRLNELVKDIQA